MPCLHELFDAVAARRGSAPAAMDHGRTISYEELKARSDRLARRLYKAGVSHGDRVGVSGGRSLDALVAFPFAKAARNFCFPPFEPSRNPIDQT